MKRHGAALLAPTIAILAACGAGAGDRGPNPRGSGADPSATVRSAAGWSGEAEAICAEAYAQRGSPPRAASGDPDEATALAEMWRGNLAFRAAERLARLPDPPSAALRLVDELLAYADLSGQLAGVHHEGGDQPDRLRPLQSRRDEATTAVRAAAGDLTTPSCALLVDAGA